jgi:DNA topoisomerase-1
LAKKKRHETGELGLSDNGEVISLLTGRFGAFVQQGEKSVEGRKPKTASVPKGVEPEDVDLAMAKKLLSLPRIICEHPETRKTIWAKQGPHGPYIDHDGDTRSLGAEDDVYTIGCNHAVDLLAQPKKARSFRRGSEKIRSLGPHSEDGNEVAIYKGQYGHYIKHNKTNAGLPKHSDAETITIEKAEQVVTEKASKPKKPSKKKKAATKRKRNPRPKKDD